MPYTTLVAGTTITASWANTNVRNQVVSTFADSAARAAAITAPTEGMVSYLTGNNRLDVYNSASWSTLINPSSGAWVSYAPTVQQNAATIAATVDYGAALRVGRKVTASWYITLNASGSAGLDVRIVLPIAARYGLQTAGSCTLIDASTGFQYSGVMKFVASDIVNYLDTNLNGTTEQRMGVAGFTVALASGDVVSGTLDYEAAADA